MISQSLEDTRAFAKEFSKDLSPGSVVALYGDLGAGKTTLAKEIISSLTDVCPDAILSPTFTYMNLYPHDVCHFDLYRLSNAEQFLSAGFEEFIGKPYITLIEWPSRIEELLTFAHKKISITILDEQSRSFSCS